MNPYLKSMPPVPEDFNAAMMKESASTVKQLAQQHNSLTGIHYIERLPDYRIMQRDLKQRGPLPACVAPVLWMLGQSYELLPVPISPGTDRLYDVHFLYNSPALIDAILRTPGSKSAFSIRSRTEPLPALRASTRQVRTSPFITK